MDDVRVRGWAHPLMRTLGEGAEGTGVCPIYALP